eukprot:3900808-Pyramimonas_sp.AAC.2
MQTMRVHYRIRVLQHRLPAIFQLRKLEEAGLSTAQAEALTESMVTLLGHSAERMNDFYVTKPELEKVEGYLTCLRCIRPAFYAAPWNISLARCVCVHSFITSQHASNETHICLQSEIRHESTLQLYRHDFKQHQENEFARMKREIDRLKVECENLRAELK